MEQQVCLDPTVSLYARTLIRLGRIEAARGIINLIDVNTAITGCGYQYYIAVPELKAAIVKHFDLEI